jgi:hypothetical protein
VVLIVRVLATLAAKLDQLADVSNPLFDADASGKLNVIVAPPDMMLKSVPEVPLAVVNSPYNPLSLLTAWAQVTPFGVADEAVSTSLSLPIVNACHPPVPLAVIRLPVVVARLFIVSRFFPIENVWISPVDVTLKADVMVDVANVCVAPVCPFSEVIPVPPQDSHETPYTAVELAVTHFPFAPTERTPYRVDVAPTSSDPTVGLVLVPVPPCDGKRIVAPFAV